MTDAKAPDNCSPALGDWRLMTATWATGADGQIWDEPRALRGSTLFVPIGGNQFWLATPSAAALHLIAAWKTAKRAQEVKEGLTIDVYMTGRGGYSMQASEHRNAALFDYFEEMISVAFGGFGAIEAFCSQLVIELAKAPITLKRRSGSKVLAAEAAEREASTDEKLKRLVPDPLGIATPSGKKTWKCYLHIKRKRDAITHFKRHDQMRIEKAYEPAMLLDLYTLDCFKLPEQAMAVLKYLRPEALQRWMVNADWKRPATGSDPPMPWGRSER